MILIHSKHNKSKSQKSIKKYKKIPITLIFSLSENTCDSKELANLIKVVAGRLIAKRGE